MMPRSAPARDYLWQPSAAQFQAMVRWCRALPPAAKDWIRKQNISEPQGWIFPQDNDPQRPMWDSGVRKALKIAAQAVGCDFPGFGLHSLRRANITWRQEVGASAIEASKIAGHSSVNMTNDYTHVQLRRQENLTRAIQQRLKRVVKPSNT
jgi:integrase